MAKVHHNDIILSDAEAKELNSKLDKITTITELITIMKETYLLADIELQLSWNPTYKSFEHWNKIIPAFAGPISGKNIDISGTKRSDVYSISCITSGMSTFDNLFRIHTTSGGGGKNWSYNTAYIDIRKFPAMKELYTAEISEATIKSEKAKFQHKFDKEVAEFSGAVTRIVGDVTYSDKIRKIDQQISDFEKLLQKLKEFRQNTINSDVSTKVKKANLTLPQAQSPFIDLGDYNRAAARITGYGITEDLYTKTISSAQLEYDKFVSSNPELFL